MAIANYLGVKRFVAFVAILFFMVGVGTGFAVGTRWGGSSSNRQFEVNQIPSGLVKEKDAIEQTVVQQLSLIEISDGPPVIITSTVDTSDWQIFEEDVFGYRFKYPKGWFLWKRHMEPSNSLGIYSPVVEISPTDNNIDPSEWISVRVIEIRPGNTLREDVSLWYNRQRRFYKEYSIPVESLSRVIVGSRETLVNSVTLERGRPVSPFFKAGNFLFNVQGNGIGIGDIGISRDTYNAILLSFGFDA